MSTSTWIHDNRWIDARRRSIPLDARLSCLCAWHDALKFDVLTTLFCSPVFCLLACRIDGCSISLLLFYPLASYLLNRIAPQPPACHHWLPVRVDLLGFLFLLTLSFLASSTMSTRFAFWPLELLPLLLLKKLIAAEAKQRKTEITYSFMNLCMNCQKKTDKWRKPWYWVHVLIGRCFDFAPISDLKVGWEPDSCSDRLFEAINGSCLHSLKVGCEFGLSEAQLQMLARNTNLTKLSVIISNVNQGLATLLRSSSIANVTVDLEDGSADELMQKCNIAFKLSPTLTTPRLFNFPLTSGLAICQSCDFSDMWHPRLEYINAGARAKLGRFSILGQAFCTYTFTPFWSLAPR